MNFIVNSTKNFTYFPRYGRYVDMTKRIQMQNQLKTHFIKSDIHKKTKTLEYQKKSTFKNT